MNQSVAFDCAELSDQGRVRKENQDACLCLPQAGIYCLADGMGGAAAGGLASGAIITSLRKAFGSQRSAAALPLRISAVRDTVNAASAWIRDYAEENALGQMGSTVLLLLLDPARPWTGVALHAGDSRLYRCRNGALELLTIDHTTLSALAVDPELDLNAVPVRYCNELTRAVGLKRIVDLEQTPFRPGPRDLLLLCSDGLTRMLSEDEIAAALRHSPNESLAVLARRLIDLANAAGGKDNVSVILVRLASFGEAGERWPGEEDEGATEISSGEDTAALLSPPAAGGDEKKEPALAEGSRSSRSTVQGAKPPAPWGRAIPLIAAFFLIVFWTWSALHSNPSRVARTPPGLLPDASERLDVRALCRQAEHALEGENFLLALSNADQALKLIPGEPAAARVRYDAERQLGIQKELSERNAAAQHALDRGDYRNAVAQADEVLRLKPSDRAAGEIRQRAREKLANLNASAQNLPTASSQTNKSSGE